MGLHTRGQWPTDDVFQNAYVIALFVGFGTKSLAGGEKLSKIRMKIQTLLEWTNLVFF
jgi:hypothetical protein